MLTILVPTYERNYFLTRKLHNLAAQNCPYRVLILDSSRPNTADENMKAAHAVRHTINLDYRHLGTEAHFAQKIGIGLNEAETPYLIVSCDDDFVNLKTVNAGMDGLSKTSSFVSASGLVANFVRVGDASFPERRVPVPGKSIVFDSPNMAERFECFLTESRARNPLFHVWRREVIANIYRPVSKAPWRKYSEILFDHAAIYVGRTLLLSGLLEVRHIDYNKIAYRNEGLSEFRRGIEAELTDPNFVPMFSEMLDVCARIMSVGQGISEAEACTVVARNFLRYRTRRQPLTYQAPSLCDHLANTKAAGMLNRVRRLTLLLAKLSSPSRFGLIHRLLELHGRTATIDMLQNDPELRLNYFSLMSSESLDRDFIAGVYRTLAAYPEPENV